MPRFIVTLCDLTTTEISSELIRAVDKPAAVIQHTWFTNIYKDEWVAKVILAPQIEEVQENCKEVMNWSMVCRNLDNLLLQDLNGGDSSVSEVPLNHLA